MRIEQLPFTDTAIGRRVIGIVRSITTAATAAQRAYRLAQAAPSMSPVRLEAEAVGIVQGIVRAGMQIRSAPVSPREKNLGAWKPFNGLHSVNDSVQAALRDADARRAKTTSGAGIVPTAFAPFPEINLGTIAATHRRCDVQGWCDNKSDISLRLLRGDSHLQGVDRIRRSATYKAPFRIRPRSSSPVDILTAAAVRSAWDSCDGFISSMGEAGVMASQGFALQELVWRDAVVTVPVGGKRFVRIPSEIVASLEPVYNRNAAFDVVNDRAFVCMGAGSYVDAQDPGLQKFCLFRGHGDGPARYRGYSWATDWLSFLAQMSLEKWAIVIETWGLSSPVLLVDEDGNASDEAIARAIAALERIGTGQPAVISSRAGKLDYTPVPSGLAPMHAQILGFLNAERSKAALSATLQVESSQSGVGSFAMANTHLSQQTDTQRIDAVQRAEALRAQPFTWLCEVNAERWATAFSRYVPGGCSPAEVAAAVPLCEWVISDELPTARLAVFQGVKNLGFAVDEEQVREELGVRAPLDNLAEPPPELPPEQPPAAPATPPAPAPQPTEAPDAE